MDVTFGYDSVVNSSRAQRTALGHIVPEPSAFALAAPRAVSGTLADGKV